MNKIEAFARKMGAIRTNKRVETIKEQHKYATKLIKIEARAEKYYRKESKKLRKNNEKRLREAKKKYAELMVRKFKEAV